MTIAMRQNQPWHERYKSIGTLRSCLRNMLFQVPRKWLATDEGRAAVTDAVRAINCELPLFSAHAFDAPYPDLGMAAQGAVDASDRSPIFVTARFRSGSTLLWNIFRHLDDCTAYYEPLNERRWFDPSCRGTRVDATHRDVNDYWREYEGLPAQNIPFNELWTSRHLYMDSDFSDIDLQRYIGSLIETAPARPVLQFNRIDFRLPWIRRQFPSAQIVHIFRHPRDQWFSTLVGSDPCPRDIRPADFTPYDKFYLLRWARDLRYRFPFLDEHSVRHPYQLFYLIWKLSYAFGKTYSDCSLAYESLTRQPEEVLPNLFARLDIQQYDLPKMCALVDPPREGAWRQYADDEWFRELEAVCETTFADFFSVSEPVPFK